LAVDAANTAHTEGCDKGAKGLSSAEKRLSHSQEQRTLFFCNSEDSDRQWVAINGVWQTPTRARILHLARVNGGEIMKCKLMIAAVFILSSVLVGCSTSMTTREKGAAIGAVGGAAAGGIIGSAVGSPGTGAAVGGALGLGAGALIGDRIQALEQKQTELEKQLEASQSELEQQKKELEQIKKENKEQ
jgi:hypothetical protein